MQQRREREGCGSSRGNSICKGVEALCTGSGALNRSCDGTLKERTGHKTVLFVSILSDPLPQEEEYKQHEGREHAALSAAGDPEPRAALGPSGGCVRMNQPERQDPDWKVLTVSRSIWALFCSQPGAFPGLKIEMEQDLLRVEGNHFDNDVTAEEIRYIYIYY